MKKFYIVMLIDLLLITTCSTIHGYREFYMERYGNR